MQTLMLAIIPFFITVIINEMEDSKIIGKAGKMIRLVLVLRVMRIFKLVRHFQGLQAMLQTMREAYRDLSLLGALVATQTFLFSILVFVTEKDSDQAWSLIDSVLWSILTVSTVGAGGQHPASTIGRFLGGLCPILGVCVCLGGGALGIEPRSPNAFVPPLMIMIPLSFTNTHKQ